jgi:hypothetical protein
VEQGSGDGDGTLGLDLGVAVGQGGGDLIPVRGPGVCMTTSTLGMKDK